VTSTSTPRKHTPVTVTERHPSFRSGRLEIWAAVSTDGTYTYNRIEDTGTLWAVEYVPEHTDCGLFSSLPKARRATASGEALAAVNRPVATRHSPGQPVLSADDELLYRREQGE